MQDSVGAQGGGAKTRVFISYSRKDMGFADRLEAALKARGFEVLIDREEIYAFEDWWKRIQALIGQSDTVIFALSPDAVKSEVALKEVAHAASLNKRFAPIICRQVEAGMVPETLRQLNYLFFDDPEGFETSADRLAEALQTDIAWVRQHTEYGEAERRWSAAGRPNGLLLHSPTMEVAEYWLASRPRGAPEPTREIQNFVAASRHGARAAQRFRRLVMTSMFALLVAVILGLIGWINQEYIKQQWTWYTVTLPYAKRQVRPYVLSAAKEQSLKTGDTFMECARDCPEMVVVPAGSFVMGSLKEGAVSFMMGGPLPAGQPLHTVKFAKVFAVSKYEVTFADWDACVLGGGCDGYRPNDDGWGRGRQPVINVNWFDARRYAQWLVAVTGEPYRLLSEAEYEYATRAGTTTEYPWGDDLGKGHANCKGCGSKWDNRQTAPVGAFPPNKFGLYDMVGNLWEWTEDCWHENYNGAPIDGSAWVKQGGADCGHRDIRGGSWGDTPDNLRPANRNWDTTDDREDDYLGFRVVRALDRR